MKKLTKRVIWMFAIGQLGWSTLSALVTNWVISFYEPNQEMLEAGQTVFLPQGRVVFGVVTILGGIYALGRLFDAITDPWIANLSDKSKNPKGRRLPFMRRAAIPLTAATILIYWTPINGTSPVNGIWVLVMMLLFYLFMTVYCTPYNALIAELSGTQEELTAISTAISFTFIFGSALGYACPFIWGALTPSLGRVMAIRVTFIILAAIALICLLVPTFTINEFDYVDVKPVEGNAFSSLTKTFSNKDFRIFVGSDICYWVAITMFQSGLTFFITSLAKQKRHLEDKIALALNIFYKEVPTDLKKAIDVILWFYARGDSDKKSGKKEEKGSEDRIYSFEHDANDIFSAFWHDYKMDLNEIEYLHWWKFKSLFEGLNDENKICKIMGYRAVDLSKIKDKDRRKK